MELRRVGKKTVGSHLGAGPNYRGNTRRRRNVGGGKHPLEVSEGQKWSGP